MLGKRFCAVTETEKTAKLQSSFIKRLRDQSSEIEARNLYKEPVRFCPQFMLVLSTNVDLSWTSMDGGIKRSVVGIPWPVRFTKNPDSSKGEKRVDPTLKEASLFAQGLNFNM